MTVTSLPVRVWLGYMHEAFYQAPDKATVPYTSQAKFEQVLNDGFIEATLTLQYPAGLCAYAPTLLGANAGASLPNEIALVAYGSPELHNARAQSLLGRIYRQLHDTAFRFKSNTTFGEPFSRSDCPQNLAEALHGDLAWEVPYYVGQMPDWKQGGYLSVRVYRHATLAGQAFADPTPTKPPRAWSTAPSPAWATWVAEQGDVTAISIIYLHPQWFAKWIWSPTPVPHEVITAWQGQAPIPLMPVLTHDNIASVDAVPDAGGKVAPVPALKRDATLAFHFSRPA